MTLASTCARSDDLRGHHFFVTPRAANVVRSPENASEEQPRVTDLPALAFRLG
jgi:hypothetical protein